MGAIKVVLTVFSSISPRNGHKLGASATWSKVKYQSHQYTSKITTKNQIDFNSSKYNHKVVKFGNNGEILISYGQTIEIWDWIPSVLELNELENDNNQKKNFFNLDADENDQTLYLVASMIDLKIGLIIDINPINCDQKTNTYTILITSILSNETIFTLKSFGQLFKEDFLQNLLILPPFVHGLSPFTIKNSSKFIGIATNEGSLTIFDTLKKHPLPLSLEASIIDDQVMFSISGRYLAYVPNLNNDQIDDVKTPLNIPETNKDSIYSKILNNLSITAIDGVLKLSDINSIKKNLYDHQNLTNNLKNYITNLINGFKQNQFIIIYDLIKQIKIGCFQPPNGISNLSLSPFNSQLVSISSRGDQLYNWDLSKLPLEISLIDIQIRGKTGSIVDEIYWSQQNSIEIITRSSGSIHCFKNNGDVDDNWILSNMKCNSISKTNNSNNLIAYCKDDFIYLIDSKNGSTSINYQLPKSPIPKSLLPNYIKLETIDEKIIRNDQDQKNRDYEIPISQIEIETCNLTSPLYTNKKIQLGYYDYNNPPKEFLDDCHDDFNNFEEFNYKNAGCTIGFKPIQFSKGSGIPIFNKDNESIEENGLIEAINDVLVVEE